MGWISVEWMTSNCTPSRLLTLDEGLFPLKRGAKIEVTFSGVEDVRNQRLSLLKPVVWWQSSAIRVALEPPQALLNPAGSRRGDSNP